MVEKKRKFPAIIIKHRGFFNLEKVLKTITNWFNEEDFEDFDITDYKYKIPSPAGAEYEIRMKGQKKVTGYVMFEIEVILWVYDLREVELIKDGEKIKTNEGRIIIEVFPVLILDWQKRFGGNKFLQRLQDFYHNYIIKYKIADYWDDMCLIKAGQLVKFVQESLSQEVT
ncbi:hypothetical protein DRJ22_01385 [Candidatus Woesearchaeota archaeon]|nr:MAG: hypothetical protein B6U93_00735 [Candidatus Woesearchaeota archaeon ex4484_78]RLE46654.1 MAG: hypothetical protein DRJ22_01385 [Candidatus Woesearchaeota archaeon]